MKLKKLYSDFCFKINPPKVGVIATPTRSGTWFCRCFFFALHKLLRGDRNFDSADVVREFYAEDRQFKVKNTLGLDKLLIYHATCPGFKDHYHGSLRTAWDKLKFYGEGRVHDNGDIIMQAPKRKRVFDPYHNRKAKIVYVYRNPLDSSVSFMKALENYKDPQVMYKTSEFGERTSFKDVRDYFYSAGLQAFIKQIFTFKEMKKMYPQNIVMMPYELLVRDPEKNFGDMLAHFGCKLDTKIPRELIKRAIGLSSQENLKSAEQKLGMNLANDRAKPGDTQIRGGQIGKWKAYFNRDDLEAAEKKMNEFHLSLKDCILE